MRRQMPQVHSMLKLHVLMAIAGKPVHGYELLQAIAMRTGRSVSPSQIYPFLAQLRRNGLLAVDSEGARDRKSYRLTPAGRALVSGVVRRCSDVIDFAVRSRVKPCLHCGAEIYAGEYRRKIKGKTAYFCCPHCAADYDDSESRGGRPPRKS